MSKGNGRVKIESFPSFNDDGWASIDGWKDYNVHKDGFVMSVKTAYNKLNRTEVTTKKILSIFTVKGYAAVNLIHGDTRKSVRVHRLVAEAFIKKVPGKFHVNHIDGNKTNASVDNLEWCTPSENETHSYKVLGKKSNGTVRRVLTMEQAEEIRSRSIEKNKDLAIEFDVCPTIISNIMRGVTYV